jgi:ABC-2 type transport system permease protein
MSGAVEAPRPRRLRSTFVELYGLLLRMQVTPLRIAGIAALGLVAVALAVATRTSDDPVRATTEVALGYGLSFVLPLATLWLATSCVGDLVEDRLIAYLWLKPVPRWQLPAAAVLTTSTIVMPLVAVPLVLAAIVAGTAELVGALLLASSVAVLAYSGLFVAAGLFFRRALWFGLFFVLVWENGLARVIEGVARMSIASYTQTLVADAAGVSVRFADRAPTASIVVPLVVAVAGFAIAVARYRRAEVD